MKRAVSDGLGVDRGRLTEHGCLIDAIAPGPEVRRRPSSRRHSCVCSVLTAGVLSCHVLRGGGRGGYYCHVFAAWLRLAGCWGGGRREAC